MHRFLRVGMSATLLLAACKIEQTPRQYYSQRNPASVERETAAGELHARVSAVGAALDRGDVGGAVAALAPAPDAYVIGPDGGNPAVGPDGLAGILRSLADTVPVSVRARDVRVTLGARAETAWFAAALEVTPEGTPPASAPLSLSGVYRRQRGAWLLVQAHLSRPFTPPAAPPPPSPADSAAPGAAAAEEAPASGAGATSARSRPPAGTPAAPTSRP